MDLSREEYENIMAERGRADTMAQHDAAPEPRRDPQAVQMMLYVVGHKIDQASEHADAVNAVLADVVAPTGLLQAPKFRTVEAGGELYLLTEIWVAEPRDD